MSQHNVILLLGSNLGERKKNLNEALQIIEKNVGNIEKKTEFLESVPVEYDSNNIFCNIAVNISTYFSPVRVLLEIKKIEQNMGRLTDSMKTGFYEDRLIDIDIICFDRIFFKCNKLQIPHYKHINEREFSAKLLSELDEKHK